MFVSRDADSQLKIIDFGFSRRRTSEETAPCFTLDYAAPESLTKGPTKESRDMWSLGVILYTMLCGNTPFMPQNISKQQDEKNYRLQLTDKIKRGRFNQSEPWGSLSDQAQHLIENLLQVDESKRLTLGEVLKHEWVTQDDDTDDDAVDNSFENLSLTANGPKSHELFTESEPITVDDDSMDAQPKENGTREEVCSNDSSGIVLSDRNECSSLSSHVEEEAEEPPQEVPNIVVEVPEEKRMPILEACHPPPVVTVPKKRGRPKMDPSQRAKPKKPQLKVKIERNKISPVIKLEKATSRAQQSNESNVSALLEDQLDLPLKFFEPEDRDDNDVISFESEVKLYNIGLWEHIIMAPPKTAPKPSLKRNLEAEISEQPRDVPPLGESKVKRKRQKKPKAESTAKEQAVVVYMDPELEAAPIKRGPGRPKKVKLERQPKFEKTHAQPVTIEKKKRGRKRKAEKLAAVEEEIVASLDDFVPQPEEFVPPSEEFVAPSEEIFEPPPPKKEKRMKKEKPAEVSVVVQEIKPKPKRKYVKKEPTQKPVVFAIERLTESQPSPIATPAIVKRPRGRPKKNTMTFVKPERSQPAAIKFTHALEQPIIYPIYQRPDLSQRPIHNHNQFRQSFIVERVTYWSESDHFRATH